MRDDVKQNERHFVTCNIKICYRHLLFNAHQVRDGWDLGETLLFSFLDSSKSFVPWRNIQFWTSIVFLIASRWVHTHRRNRLHTLQQEPKTHRQVCVCTYARRLYIWKVTPVCYTIVHPEATFIGPIPPVGGYRLHPPPGGRVVGYETWSSVVGHLFPLVVFLDIWFLFSFSHRICLYHEGGIEEGVATRGCTLPCNRYINFKKKK